MDASSSSDVVVSPNPINRGKIPWPGGPSFKQNWSLPESIVYYISKNPTSPELYLKLVESCKFFFEKNPVLVVTKMDNCKDDVNSFICKNNLEECLLNNRKCCIKIDINEIASKIWLANELHIQNDVKNFIPLLLPKLFRCEIYSLYLFHKELLFDDYKFIVSSAKEVFLYNTSIFFNDGKAVMLDKILGCIPNVKGFSFTFRNDDVLVPGATMKNLLKLQNLQNLLYFQLGRIPESFAAVEDLSDFITKHKALEFYLGFNQNISEHYKNQLDVLVDAVIESETRNRAIVYEGLDEEKYRIMRSRW